MTIKILRGPGQEEQTGQIIEQILESSDVLLIETVLEDENRPWTDIYAFGKISANVQRELEKNGIQVLRLIPDSYLDGCSASFLEKVEILSALSPADKIKKIIE